MDAQRERLIGRHNRVSTTAGNCRSVIGFSIMGNWVEIKTNI